MSNFLDSIGATLRVRAHFEPFASRGLSLARISRVNRGAYEILCESGGEIAAEPTGALVYAAGSPADLPSTGDWVAVQTLGELAIVHAVLPRQTAFARRAAGTREEMQIIASNVDRVFVVCGLDGDFNVRRLERYLILARESGAEAVILLNKSDLCPHFSARTTEAMAIAPGVSIEVVQANSTAGVQPILKYLAFGRTVALLGSSGAGKSTLVNQLLGADSQATGEVREHDSRGRHTTTYRQLIPLPQGGALIDTAGLREIQLWAGGESLDEVFDEIRSAAQQCRFGDCSHSGEPGCAVKAGLESGSIDPARWESYRKLAREIRYHEISSDPLAANLQKRRWKQVHKAMRNVDKRK